MNTLDIKLFMQSSGTITSMNIVEGNIYYTQLSIPRGSAFLPVADNDFSEIKLISVSDFLAGKDTSKTLAHLPGQITASCLSSDKKALYFIHRILLDNKYKKAQSYIRHFEISSKSISDIAPYDTWGKNLIDVDSTYLIEFDSIYADVLMHDKSIWTPILPDKTARRSVYAIDGDIYYMLNHEIFLVKKSSILDESYTADKIYTLQENMRPGDLFVDNNRNVYVTIYNSNPPIVLNVSEQKKNSVSQLPIRPANVNVNTLFEYQGILYCLVWASDRPLSKDTKIIKTNGHHTQETELLAGPVDFLGIVGDYIIFNNDRVFKRRSDIFGIKYR